MSDPAPAAAAASLPTKLAAAARQFGELPRVIGLVWRAAPRWAGLWMGLLLGQALLPVATVYLTKHLVDSLAEVVSGREVSTFPVLAMVAALVVIMLLSQGARSLTSYVNTVQGNLLQDHISVLIHRQAARVDMAFYDQPDYYDHLHRARSEAQHRPAALLQNIGGLLQHGTTLIAMCAVLVPLGIWVPLVLLATTLPAVYVALRYSHRQHVWHLQATAKERKAVYYDWLLTSSDPAAEVRLFGLGEHFQAVFRSIREWQRSGERNLAKSNLLTELGAGLVTLALSGVMIGWMIWRALQQRISLGELAFFYQAFSQGQRVMQTLLQQLGQLYYNSLFLGNLFQYLDLQPQVKSPANPLPTPDPIREGIRFEDVCFQYPGCNEQVLDKVDLHLPAGRIVAIVGTNGAGKSTLIKLISRFYDPSSGRITCDGTDLRQLSLEELRRRITVLFQQPVDYNASVSENIAWGDVDGTHSDSDIREAAAAAGIDAKIRELPGGYDQMLGRWFQSGAELSVGQWQRIALARAFVRRAPLIILDEPTSALDPWAESDWFERFHKLVAGRSALIITHRFTTAMHADIIHVMDHGKIVESGSHEELIQADGHYALAWKGSANSTASNFPPAAP